ncbi:polyprenyl synthetase family protein [Bifidobacterium sp. ESL0784]|uniref:polyprenyl synthetase family protein n=1 Tax=Bifidobacterium sp. ESL0784 TaxID=2983231 RepID=UPI0023F7EB1A|nr:polyprenyl synthetase family protein [Bifidobacterium sp. ESL0784]MDF7641291.1 polyprenyl synthetase family protein [Bifidobacterium sp. ESL0784]
MSNQQELLLRDDLKRVVQTMHSEEDNVTPYREDYRHLLDNHGKMVRASLVLLFSYVVQNDEPHHVSDKIITGAAAIEMLHLATLVHDDVLDNASVRRNQPTIQTVRGNKAAIYLGDLILSRYMEIIATIAPSTDFIAEQAHTVNEIVSGDLLQESARHNTETSKEYYERAITGKTAALFRLAAITGIKLTTDSPAAKTLEQGSRFGEHLGIAFQILDDVEDFNVAHDTGKPKLEDIRDGIYTLPVILAIKADPSFVDIVKLEDPLKVLDYFKANPQFIKAAKDEALQHLEAAKGVITDAQYPSINAGTVKALVAIIDKYIRTL